jgi:hypothetical protein
LKSSKTTQNALKKVQNAHKWIALIMEHSFHAKKSKNSHQGIVKKSLKEKGRKLAEICNFFFFFYF